MKLILNTIWTVVILVMMNNAMARETHENENQDVIWFSTSTSALLNRSSTELATQHINRGIRLARLALKKELAESDKLIANHNLCAGLLSKGDAEAAEVYCTRATEMAKSPFNLVKIRGAFYLTEKTVVGYAHVTTPLFQVVLSNIELHNSHIRVSLK